MALIKTIESKSFLMTITDAYHKINNININVSQNNISVDMVIYASKNARILNARPVDNKIINIPLKLVEDNSGDTFIARIYNVIKDIVFEYKDSVDDLTENEANIIHPQITGTTENI